MSFRPTGSTHATRDQDSENILRTIGRCRHAGNGKSRTTSGRSSRRRSPTKSPRARRLRFAGNPAAVHRRSHRHLGAGIRRCGLARGGSRAVGADNRPQSQAQRKDSRVSSAERATEASSPHRVCVGSAPAQVMWRAQRYEKDRVPASLQRRRIAALVPGA